MLVFMILSLILSSVSGNIATAAGGCGWYVKRNSDHRQPELDPAFSYIEKYEAYYLDKRCADEGAEAILYLTFDAGYENGNIAKILDTLKEQQVPAAFFILDHLIKANGDLVERMAAEGHLVCNHSLRHRDMSAIEDREAFRYELEELERLYHEKTGRTMAKYYRPPEGRFNERSLSFANELGYKTVFWSFAYADWDNKRQPSAGDAIKKILDNTHPGAVILLHPTSATNAEILPTLIERWREMGYRFGTLDELCSG